MELGTLDFWYANREWQALVGGRIQKIYVKDSMHVLQIYQQRLYQFVFVPGAAFFSQAKISFPQKPTGYCMFLRKRLDGGRIRAVSLVGFDRIIKLTIETKEGELDFVIELFDEVNSLVLKNNAIVSALKYREYSDRTLRGGLQYTPPPSKPAPWESDPSALRGNPAGKAIAVQWGLGGKWSAEILTRAGMEKTTVLSEVHAPSLLATVTSLRDMALAPCWNSTEALPFAFLSKQGEWTGAPTFNEAIDAVLSPALSQAAISEHKERETTARNKQQKIIAAQRASLDALEELAVQSQRSGELIYEQYATLQPFLDSLRADWKHMSFAQIKDKYGKLAFVKDIRPDGTLDVEFTH